MLIYNLLLSVMRATKGNEMVNTFPVFLADQSVRARNKYMHTTQGPRARAPRISLKKGASYSIF